MKDKLNIGDAMYRSKQIFEHKGNYFGQGMVIHNSPDTGTTLCSIKEYSNDKPIKVVASNLSISQQEQFQERACDALKQGKKYNVLTDNCEQLASQLLNDNSGSSQLRGTIIGGTFVGAVAKCSNSKHTALFTLIGAVAGLLITNAARKYDFQI